MTPLNNEEIWSSVQRLSYGVTGIMGLNAEERKPGVALIRGVSISMALSSRIVVGVEDTWRRERFFGGIVAQIRGFKIQKVVEKRIVDEERKNLDWRVYIKQYWVVTLKTDEKEEEELKLDCSSLMPGR